MKTYHEYHAENSGEGGDAGGSADSSNTDIGDNVSAGSGGTDTGATDGAGAGQSVANWPSDWRAKLSPDGKHSKMLDRFSSPNAVLDSYLALRQKLDSGELKATASFPKDGATEDQAAWRKAHGVPERAEDYHSKFTEGLVIGDDDKPAIEEFLKSMHGVNASPDVVNSALNWYYDQQAKALTTQEEQDTDYLSKSEDVLRAEWGGEYRTNINMIRGLVDTVPESIRDAFCCARLGDGTALLNHPEMARWLNHIARTVNPVATVVPNAGANVSSVIADEISAIEKVMKTDRKAYNDDGKMQQRLRDLYDARERAAR